MLHMRACIFGSQVRTAMAYMFVSPQTSYDEIPISGGGAFGSKQVTKGMHVLTRRDICKMGLRNGKIKE